MPKVTQQALTSELLTTMLPIGGRTCVRGYERGAIRTVTRGPRWDQRRRQPLYIKMLLGPGRGGHPSLWGLCCLRMCALSRVHPAQSSQQGRGPGMREVSEGLGAESPQRGSSRQEREVAGSTVTR